MKKIWIVFAILFAIVFTGCSPNDFAQMNYEREAREAKYQSEYATTVNKLETERR